jgi:hypothetical protein
MPFAALTIITLVLWVYAVKIRRGRERDGERRRAFGFYLFFPLSVLKRRGLTFFPGAHGGRAENKGDKWR